jgi:hypothetical protein
MGYPTKVQLIKRSRGPEQWYINFPTALAEALDLQKGEVVHWHIEDKAHLILHRQTVAPSLVAVKKTSDKAC